MWRPSNGEKHANEYLGSTQFARHDELCWYPKIFSTWLMPQFRRRLKFIVLRIKSIVANIMFATGIFTILVQNSCVKVGSQGKICCIQLMSHPLIQ